MQIGAINSVNFQGRARVQREEDPDIKLERAIDKAQNNVHLMTVAVGGATTAAAITKGKDCIALLTKIAATAGEGISKAAVKAGASIAGAINKTNIDTTKAEHAIENTANILRNENPKICDNMVNPVVDAAKKIFGSDAAESTKRFMSKYARNPVEATQLGVATAVGLGVANRFTDKVEDRLDDHDINRAAKEDPGLRILGKVTEAIGEFAAS